MWKVSKNPIVEELTKSYKERSYNLSDLQAVKLQELNEKGKNKRLCAWCASKELFHGNQKYCSEECSDSAMAWAYPQKENALKFLLKQQNWKCNDCQFDYSSYLQAMIDKDKYLSKETTINSLNWFYFKRLKNRILLAVPEKALQIDHIIPISKGGTALGLENTQVLCFQCHKSKTKIDNSGKRKKNEINSK